MVNSNYYGMDLLYHKPTSRQASRAAGLCHAFFAFRSVMDKEKVKPVSFRRLLFCGSYFLNISKKLFWNIPQIV